ncbi:ABC transporter substrate-binding protein [Lichenihabitans sp. Uapishka_5]|uniref:ABC transporter substrate-binding protein n=1 Tax=Lichenihabitans sp. Uapishka_5 TaxID=3037302 RepID=UPI0029E7D0EA|nr:ABC transporter substrate-binding protein [Lichenihabitans sp. Uapishka_5]MDX7951950.1 ABC transporter substrate-binding protein [Lichenihabitans sp. Uapishka_5]
MLKKLLLAGAALACLHGAASAKDLKSIGISLGSLGNPFFIALSKGAEAEAKKTNPNVKVQTVGYDYDLGKQVTQIDNFIASGVDLILLNPGDPKALKPAIQKAQAAGIVVIAVDTAADGADAVVTTDNVQAGQIACQFIIDKIGGKGNVIIENGPQVSSVIDRVVGCKKAFAASPDIKVLSSDQDAKGSRDGGLSVAQSLLTRFTKVDGLFAINDPQVIGSDLAAKQLGRTGIVMTSVDGAPDIEAALKNPNSPMIMASASQDPYFLAQKGVQIGTEILAGKKPDSLTTLVPSKLVTRENVGDYKGWQSAR